MENSGARYVQCIKVYGGSKKKIAVDGDYILVSVKQLRMVRKVKLGQMCMALVARTKKETKYLDGSYSKFGSNSVILLDKKKRILGTRLFGSVSRKLRRKKFLRILIICGQNII